jgi:hypothetical protein
MGAAQARHMPARARHLPRLHEGGQRVSDIRDKLSEADIKAVLGPTLYAEFMAEIAQLTKERDEAIEEKRIYEKCMRKFFNAYEVKDKEPEHGSHD